MALACIMETSYSGGVTNPGGKRVTEPIVCNALGEIKDDLYEARMPRQEF